MAQNTNIDVPKATWTMLTDSNVSSVTFQNVNAYHGILIKGTNGTTAPTTEVGAIKYRPSEGERNVLLADLFPGVSGVNRLWAYSADGAQVMVSHA